jgi:hypothetical protein
MKPTRSPRYGGDEHNVLVGALDGHDLLRAGVM